MNVKRLISLVLALIFILSIASCGKDGDNTEVSENSKAVSSDPVKKEEMNMLKLWVRDDYAVGIGSFFNEYLKTTPLDSIFGNITEKQKITFLKAAFYPKNLGMAIQYIIDYESGRNPDCASFKYDNGNYSMTLVDSVSSVESKIVIYSKSNVKAIKMESSSVENDFTLEITCSNDGTYNAQYISKSEGEKWGLWKIQFKGTTGNFEAKENLEQKPASIY